MASANRSKALDARYEVRDAHLGEVQELLPLMRSYCDFYEADPTDAGLLDLAGALAGDPGQGALFIAREREGQAVGFAAMGWKWSSTRGARVGVLEDLYCAPGARGRGVAEALIEACAGRCRERGAVALEWMTAPDNRRAQAVYDRVGGVGEDWRVFSLGLGEDERASE